jgi:hypothetical protein
MCVALHQKVLTDTVFCIIMPYFVSAHVCGFFLISILHQKVLADTVFSII